MSRSAVGPLIRERRDEARRSQMDLALDVGVSPRHLSFVELGKSKPSPELVVLIADRLDVPLRERNDWLLAAGYAPRYSETPLDGVDNIQVRRSLQLLLAAHDPFPAVVIDRRWTVQLTNRAAIQLADGIADEARGVPSNIVRIDVSVACLQLQPLVLPQLGQAWHEPARIMVTPHCMHIGASESRMTPAAGVLSTGVTAIVPAAIWSASSPAVGTDFGSVAISVPDVVSTMDSSIPGSVG